MFTGEAAGALEFAYNAAAAAVGVEFGIKKGIVDLIRRVLPRNVWQPHLTESDGENTTLKKVGIFNLIQAITDE